MVRLWATREGLVGRTTSAGHLITPNDHFVALPSRKAINKNVIVSYRGKTVTAPVLDIGPWNRDEAWWETGAARGQFGLTALCGVWAAFENGHNGGRDAIGRYVTFLPRRSRRRVYADLHDSGGLGRRDADGSTRRRRHRWRPPTARSSSALTQTRPRCQFRRPRCPRRPDGA